MLSNEREKTFLRNSDCQKITEWFTTSFCFVKHFHSFETNTADQKAFGPMLAFLLVQYSIENHNISVVIFIEIKVALISDAVKGHPVYFEMESSTCSLSNFESLKI